MGFQLSYNQSLRKRDSLIMKTHLVEFFRVKITKRKNGVMRITLPKTSKYIRERFANAKYVVFCLNEKNEIVIMPDGWK